MKAKQLKNVNERTKSHMGKNADDPLVLYYFPDFSLHTPVLSSWTILIPVAMDMGGTESEAVVQQCWVNHVTWVCSLQQVPKVAQVPVTSSHSISSTVLIQNKDLTWAKPALQAERSREKRRGSDNAAKGYHMQWAVMIGHSVIQHSHRNIVCQSKNAVKGHTCCLLSKVTVSF